jgi:hypothetical protein
MAEISAVCSDENVAAVVESVVGSETPELETPTLIESPGDIESTRTIPPTHAGDTLNDCHDKGVLAETCEKLLVKLEEIRTAVLHLQYSLHAGELGAVAANNVERSGQLWAWNQGGVFSAEVSTGLLQGALDNVFSAGFPDTPDGCVKIGPEEIVNEDDPVETTPPADPVTADPGTADPVTVTVDQLNVPDVASGGV